MRHSISQRGGARFLPSSQRRKWPTGAFGLTPIRPVGPRRGFVRQNPLGAKRRRRGGKARTSASTTLAGFVNPAIPGLRLGLEVPHHPESVVVVLVVGRVPVAVRGTLFLHELVRMPVALEGQGLQVHGHAHQETAAHQAPNSLLRETRASPCCTWPSASTPGLCLQPLLYRRAQRVTVVTRKLFDALRQI